VIEDESPEVMLDDVAGVDVRVISESCFGLMREDIVGDLGSKDTANASELPGLGYTSGGD
jgi:hypothetical protein